MGGIRSLVRLCTLGLAVILSSLNGWSQYDPSRSTGAPLTIYNGSNIDNVNTLSGNLRISLPLFHLPGRGLDMDIVLTYNSKLWKTDEFWDEFAGTWYVASLDPDTNHLPTTLGQPHGAGWGLGVPGMGQWTSSVTHCEGYNFYGFCEPWVQYITWLTTDGTRNLTGNDNGLRYAFHDTQTTGYWSFDGSYIRFPSSAAMVGKYKDGATVVLEGSNNWNTTQTTLKDTNGNFIRCNSSTCTDTLGRVVNFNYANGLLQSVTYKDSSGTTQTITFTYQPYALYYPWVTGVPSTYCNMADGQCGYSNSYGLSLLTRVTLPNGRSYEFEYVLNSDGTTTGEVSKLIFPTGGYVRYIHGWAPGAPPEGSWFGQERRADARIVSEDGLAASEKTWSYAAGMVTDPLGNVELDYYQFYYPVNAVAVPTKIQFKNSAGSVVKTIDQTIACDATSYNDPSPHTNDPVSATCSNPRITSRVTTLNDTNQQSKEVLTYGTHGNVTQKSEYDWGAGAPGGLIRRTTYTYLHNSNSAYATSNVHILDRVTSQIVYDAMGNTKAYTSTSYDSSALIVTTGIVQHDYTNHPSTNLLRGNPTQIGRWLNTNGTWLTTTNTYNDVGNLIQTTDPGGHSTSFSYADNFYNYSPPQPTSAYVTQVTRPPTNGVSHLERRQFYFYSGLLAASCGENFPSGICAFAAPSGQPDYTTFTYDPLNRPVTTTQGDGGQNTLAYNEASLPITITSTTKIDPTRNLVSTSVYDGLGRLKQTQLNSNPGCVVYTNITYDALGRKASVSNPYCSTADPTYGFPTYEYDALDRVRRVIHQGGSVTTTDYSGNTTTITDPAGKKRKSEADALDRLTRASEPDANGSFVYETVYGYDTLDNLISVVQSGSRQRSFTYNSLSQLLNATNPESGMVNYSYDNDGNLITKSDARGITTTYAYDALHRLIQRSYSDSTPTAAFTYDVAVDGLSIDNPKGRLVKAAPSTARTVNSYDPMGRVKTQWQCTALNCGTAWWALNYSYNFLGGMTSYTNGAGVTFTHTFDAAARVTQLSSSLVDAQHPGTLASGITYNPAGAMTLMSYGNGLIETRAYNNRLQATEMRSYNPSTGADTLKLNYGFNLGTANNGNVTTWSATGAQAFNRTYTYDELNRIKTMSGTGGSCTGLTWNYDIWGNRKDQTTTAGACTESHLAINNLNRIADVGYQYDAAGNLTAEPGGRTYQYDAENRLISVNGGAVASYVYDAHGRRVRKIAGGTTTEYIYDLAGNVVAEKQGTVWTKGYVYLGGRMLLQHSDGTTYFAHKDHLGSTRVLSKVDKTVYQPYDYMPFGEEYSGGTGTTHKFTGKERDAESGLDYFGARFHASNFGRFVSPDPNNAGAREEDPQSWNGYAYVGNNPLNAIDPDGLDYWLTGGDKCRANIPCDKEGFVLDDNGNRVVINDEQVLMGEVRVT